MIWTKQPIKKEIVEQQASIDSINEKIETHDFGSVASLAALQNALVTYASGMIAGQFKNIAMSCSAVFGNFVNSVYYGTITRYNASRIRVELSRADNMDELIVGVYTSNTWKWDELALQSSVKSLNSNIGADFSVTAGSSSVTINSQRCEFLKGANNVKSVWIMFTLSEAVGGVLFTDFQNVAVGNSIIPIYKVSASETAVYSMRISNRTANVNGSIPAGQYVAMGLYA